MQSIKLLKDIIGHPANKGRTISALSRSVGWQIYKSFSDKPKITSFHGLKFMAFPDSSAASSVIYFDSLPDFDEMQFIKMHLKSGDHFIDIGANVGIYSLLAASLVGNHGSVEAFEANPKTAEKLSMQFDLNKLQNVRLHEVAVADKEGESQFDLTGDDCTAHIAGLNSDTTNLATVKTVTLDKCLPEKSYAMGKMDIEGAEILALKGAEIMLKTANPPIWQLELAGYSKRHGYRSDQVVDYLKEFGYRCAVYNSAAEKLEFIEKPWELGINNILSIHKSFSN